MNAFDVLSDPVRRRTMELISQREHASGEIVKVVEAEFGISQSAVSQHLRILRDTGFATVRKDGAKRCYQINPAGFDDVDAWLDQLRHFWGARMEALATEVKRGKRYGEERCLGSRDVADGASAVSCGQDKPYEPQHSADEFKSDSMKQ